MCGPPGKPSPSLARRVVDGLPHVTDVVGDVGDEQQVGVPAGHEQRQGRLGQGTVLQGVDGHVRREVVDAVERLPERHGERLGRGHAHQQRTGQARSGRHGDGVEVGQTHPGLAAGALDGGDHGLEVGPGRDLGHHAAEAGVLVDAARDRVDEQRAAAHDPDAGLVARGLEPEDERLVGAGHAGSPWVAG